MNPLLIALIDIANFASNRLAQVEAPEVDVQPLATAQEAPVTPDITRAKDAAAALVKLKGRDVLVALLDEYGAKKISDVNPAHFSAFVRKCNEQCEQAAAPVAAPTAGLLD